MDFANAALLVAMVFGLAAQAKKLIYGTNPERVVIGAVYGVALVSVFLLRQSVWAKEQVVGGHALAGLDVWSCLVIVVFISAVASAGWEALGAVKNIGTNQPRPPNTSGIGGPKAK